MLNQTNGEIDLLLISATDKIKKAVHFAIEAHQNQKYGALPYETHLLAVHKCLENFGVHTFMASQNSFFENLICAAWLHDTLEDTSTPPEFILNTFGPEVLDYVQRVTDEQGATREERKTKTYPKIKAHLGATIIKLADRIANTEASLLNNEIQFLKYKEEYKKFYSQIYVPLIAERMWSYLNFLNEQNYGQKHQSLEKVYLYKHTESDIKIEITAKFNKENLIVEDYAIGDRIKKINDGESDYERTLQVKKQYQEALVLALIKNQFYGNSAYSDISKWLHLNGIPSEHWSG